VRIRVKVKHLVYGTAAALLSVYLLMAIIVPRIELYAARDQFEAGVSESRESILRAIHHPVSLKSKWELIREYLIDSSYDGHMQVFDVYIGPGSSWVNGDESYTRLTFAWSEKLDILRDYVAVATVDGYTARAAKQLAAYYSGEGQFDQAVEVLEQTEARMAGVGNRYWRNELMLEQVRLMMQRGHIAEAEFKLAELKNALDADDFQMAGELALLEVELLIGKGRTAEAIPILEQGYAQYEQQWNKQKESFGADTGTPMILEQLETRLVQLQQAYAFGIVQSSRVSGVVRRSDGTPIARAGVFLRHKHAVNHSIISTEPYQIATDDHGQYSFDGVLPGSYQLYLGLDFDQISGSTWPIKSDEWLDLEAGSAVRQDIVLHPLMELKSPVNEAVLKESSFEFEWYEVEDAAYYNVNIGLMLENGHISSLLQANISDNRLLVQAEQLYNRATGTSYTEVDGQMVADPLTILAFSNPDNRFYWNVEAYDQTGRMITRSNGYRLSDSALGNLPFFYLKERSLTPTDQLVLEGKYEQALAAYRRSYDSNPDDIHSLRMLIRLLPSDADRLPYLQRLALLNPTDENVFALSQEYYEQGKWQAFIDSMAGYKLDDANYSYLRSIQGTALLKLGRYQEARALFEQVMNSDPSHRFVGHYIAVVMYMDVNLDSAMDIARRYSDRFMTSNGQDWLLLLQKVQAEAERTGSPDIYMDELKELLEWFFEGKNEQFEQRMSSDDVPEGKRQLLQAIINVN
jgi:tetratricopeptide (TPR) repeat protein